MFGDTVVILVHGWNVKNPEITVGKMRGVFENHGCIVESLDYGYIKLPLTLIARNPKTAARLDKRCRYWKAKGRRVIVVGHSNGVTIMHLATKHHNAPVDVAVCINPALSKTKVPCPGAPLTYVYHNRGDFAVKLGRWLRWISPKTARISRPWGAMGRVGYQGQQPVAGLKNMDCYSEHYPPHRADGHSAVFKNGNHSFWLPLIAAIAYNEN